MSAVTFFDNRYKITIEKRPSLSQVRVVTTSQKQGAFLHLNDEMPVCSLRKVDTQALSKRYVIMNYSDIKPKKGEQAPPEPTKNTDGFASSPQKTSESVTPSPIHNLPNCDESCNQPRVLFSEFSFTPDDSIDEVIRPVLVKILPKLGYRTLATERNKRRAQLLTQIDLKISEQQHGYMREARKKLQRNNILRDHHASLNRTYAKRGIEVSDVYAERMAAFEEDDLDRMGRIYGGGL